MPNITIKSVKQFWEDNPLCSIENKFELGSKDFFDDYNNQREKIESIHRSYNLHEYKDFKGKKVLDVGCGNGYVLSHYKKEGASVYGIDVTEAAIKLSKKRFEINKQNGNFSIQNAEMLKFEDNYFDCVCSMGVLHHVPDTKKAISEIYRVLKPGGRVILMFYHKNSLKYQWNFRIQSLINKKPIDQIAREFDGPNNPKGDTYSKNELLKLLKSFTGIKLSLGYIVPSDIIPKSNSWIPNKFFQPLERYFGWNLYAKGYKPSE